MRSARLSHALAAAAALLPLCLLLGAGSAHAADSTSPGATIEHAQPAQGSVRLLVSVPPTGEVDLDRVSVSLGGRKTKTSAVTAASSDAVRRTSVLAIDTSLSMRGERIAAAKRAATQYLSTVPANVDVGVVSFDDRVRLLVKPTRDRAAARSAIAGLTLKRNTALYDGVRGAVEALGPQGSRSGQRSVLVLSDGKDTTSTSLVDVASAIKTSKAKVDVVSLQQGDEGNQPLQVLAASGQGEVIDAREPSALTTAFAREADALAREIVVTAQVPAGSSLSDDVAVEVPLDSGVVSASAYVPVRSAAAQQAVEQAAEKKASTPTEVTTGPWELSRTWVFAGVGAMGAGLLGVVLVLALAKPRLSKEALVAEQMKAYGIYASGVDGSGTRQDTGSLADQARDVAQRALANNATLEAKIAARLDGAGMSLKPAEWLLIHATVTILAGFAGFVLFGASLLGAVLFLGVGAVGGWVYLSIKRTRRLRAFSAGLADTLQLMSGSLSAGLSLAQSIDTIVREGSEPMTSEFRRVIVESRLGVPLEESLQGVAQRMECRDFDWVVMAITIQRDVGGNLAELLLTVAGTLRERDFLRRHVKALSAEGRLSAYVLGGLPPGFLAYLTLTKGDYVHPLYTTPLGLIMVGGMAVMLVVGFIWMMKVAKVDL